MNLRWINTISISILSLCLLASCSKGRNYDEVYYTIEKADEWANYALEIGFVKWRLNL